MPPLPFAVSCLTAEKNGRPSLPRSFLASIPCLEGTKENPPGGALRNNQFLQHTIFPPLFGLARPWPRALGAGATRTPTPTPPSAPASCRLAGPMSPSFPRCPAPPPLPTSRLAHARSLPRPLPNDTAAARFAVVFLALFLDLIPANDHVAIFVPAAPALALPRRLHSCSDSHTNMEREERERGKGKGRGVEGEGGRDRQRIVDKEGREEQTRWAKAADQRERRCQGADGRMWCEEGGRVCVSKQKPRYKRELVGVSSLLVRGKME
jgi:hypothetical protein